MNGFISTSLCVLLIGCVVASPVPPVRINVLSSFWDVVAYGSYQQCCSATTPPSTESGSGTTIGALGFANNASLFVNAICNAASCQCYTEEQYQTFLDVTPLYVYASCEQQSSVNVTCTATTKCDSGSYSLNVTYMQASSGAQGNFWPSPLSSQCASDNSVSCGTGFTFLSGYDVPCVFDGETCTATVPLVNPTLTGGALLLGLDYAASCNQHNCASNTKGELAFECTLTSLNCAA